MLYRVNFISSKGTLSAVNTMHVITSNTAWASPFDSGNPTPQALADEINTQLNTVYRAMMGVNWNLERITAVTVPDPNDPTQVPSAGEHAVGVAGSRSVADDELPSQACGLLSLRTAFAGRSFRGRMFLPPIESSNALTDKFINSGHAYTVAVNAFKTKLDDHFTGGGTWSSLWLATWEARIVVYSPTRHKRGDEPFFAPVTTTRYDRSVHWLRSRAR